ncbi:hypothetical protein HMPREF9069_01501 [Atopobium sp. oral taxon 810 str. F0209]|nr:hypothetical protein HMPREF9069_01501 [Atopobium sp. oral taxon 810 str. F0209]
MLFHTRARCQKPRSISEIAAPLAKRHTLFHARCQTPRSTSLFSPNATYLFTPKKSTCANVKSFETECGV